MIQGRVSEAARDVGDALTGNTRLLVPAGIAVGAIVLAVTIYRWWLARVRRKGGHWSYTRLTGDARTRILRTYVRLEALLRRNGLEPRERSQTLTGYLATAAARFAAISGDLKWFENAALSAAYDPVEPSDEVAREAARRLSRLKATRLGMSSA